MLQHGVHILTAALLAFLALVGQFTSVDAASTKTSVINQCPDKLEGKYRHTEHVYHRCRTDCLCDAMRICNILKQCEA